MATKEDVTADALLGMLDRWIAQRVDWDAIEPFETLRSRIRTACTDMWEDSITAVQEVLPTTTLGIDRFHVAQHYRDGVDALRKQEVRRLKQA